MDLPIIDYKDIKTNQYKSYKRATKVLVGLHYEAHRNCVCEIFCQSFNGVISQSSVRKGTSGSHWLLCMVPMVQFLKQ